MSASVRVTDFSPLSNGLHFPNSFPPVPLVTIPIPGHGAIPIGDAANGLCGGMSFAVRDCAEAHRPPPADFTPPLSGSSAFDYLVRRLIDSFDLPAGPLRFYRWMSLPDLDDTSGPGIASQTRGEIAVVCRTLDQDELCVLGLIRTQSADPRDLGKNHQVLAYGYDLDDPTGRLTLHLYDPNHPDADTTLSCSTAAGTPLDLGYSSGEPTRGFFLNPYTRADPAPLFGGAPARFGWLGIVAKTVGRLVGARVN